MRAHTITTVLLAALLLASTGSQSLAQLSGSDDFNDNIRDPTKWYAESALFQESNGRLEFSSTGTGTEEDSWVWIKNTGSYLQDWNITLEVFNAVAPSSDNQSGSLILAVLNDADDSDIFGVGFEIGRDPDWYRAVHSGWFINGVPYWGEGGAASVVDTSSITLRIAFDAATKTLTSSWNGGSGFSTLTNFNCAGWSMGSSDSFIVAIAGESVDMAVFSGQLYADNFQATSGPSDDNYEENDIRAEAYYPGYDWEQTWLSDIEGAGIQSDDDWYRIEVESGFEHVTVTCLFTHAEGDIDIALCDSSGTELSDSYSITDNEVIDHVVPNAGAYYIQVYYGDAGNSYDLWWDDLQATTYPSISNHLDFVFIGHVRNYETPFWGEDDRYEFGFNADTDDSITNLTFTTPADETITVASDGLEGGFQTWRHTTTSPTSLAGRFGDGNYVVEITYSNGTSESTVIPFAEADGTTPLANVTTLPLFTTPDPLHDTLFSPSSPFTSSAFITLEWGDIDPNANFVDIHRHHYEQEDWEGIGFFTDLIPFADGPFSIRSIGPISFTQGVWEVELFIGNATYRTNSDGVIYVAIKEAESDYVFTVLEASEDEDSDGILNWWESLYFAGPTNAIASLDSDLDGHNNLQESITGMDPTNAASVFMITNSSPLVDNFLIEWPSVSGRVYNAYWSTNLTTDFHPMGGDIDYL